jgi:hypothetical protein
MMPNSAQNIRLMPALLQSEFAEIHLEGFAAAGWTMFAKVWSSEHTLFITVWDEWTYNTIASMSIDPDDGRRFLKRLKSGPNRASVHQDGWVLSHAYVNTLPYLSLRALHHHRAYRRFRMLTLDEINTLLADLGRL